MTIKTRQTRLQKTVGGDRNQSMERTEYNTAQEQEREEEGKNKNERQETRSRTGREISKGRGRGKRRKGLNKQRTIHTTARAVKEHTEEVIKEKNKNSQQSDKEREGEGRRRQQYYHNKTKLLSPRSKRRTGDNSLQSDARIFPFWLSLK
jgi:hypothetical protein